MLRTFWVWRQDVDYPECVLARSQELIDEIPVDWDTAKQIMLRRWPLVDGQHREIEVVIDDIVVDKYWYPDAVEGKVQ